MPQPDAQNSSPLSILATLLTGSPAGPLSSVLEEALKGQSASSWTLSQIDEVLRLFGEASVTFSDPERALHWLSSPSDVFGGLAPLAALHTQKGRDSVRAELARIEHGVYC